MFEQQLKQYADVITHVGLNIQPGQRLLISASGLVEDTAPLVRAVTRSTYEAGADLVEIFWIDPELLRARIEAAPEESLEYISEWRLQALMEHGNRQDAYLSIIASDPTGLAGLDRNKMQTIQRAIASKTMPFSKMRSEMHMNWSVAAAAGAGWAKHVFPDVSAEEAQSKLWSRIFEATRMDQADPVAAWKDHVSDLTARKGVLNEKCYTALHFSGPGTDLNIGLPPNHVWLGGSEMTKQGIVTVPNLPTEEVFTTPDFRQVNGTVAASLPLNLNGTIVEGMRFRFEEGRIVHFEADQNGDVLEKMLDFDEGARQLGEVALVPHSSPISKTGTLFYNTLYDENAASHIAIGRAYSIGIKGGEKLSPEELNAAGANHSMIHIDFMIGSDQVDVDGIRPDGQAEPLMRAGEWV